MNAIGRVAFAVLYPLVWVYVRFVRVPRTRIIVVSPVGNVLLVKSWFGRQKWSLPGGGIGSHEDPVNAAVREAREEAGVLLDVSRVKSLGRVTLHEGISMDYDLFLATSEGEPLPKLSFLRRIEIIDRAWMPIADAPDEIRHLVETYI